jgi:transposase
MKEFIGCDAHKKYSVFVRMNEAGQYSRAVRVPHEVEAYGRYLATLPPGSASGLETTANWYWMVDEMERAQHRPRLGDGSLARARMGHRSKDDTLDGRGLAQLLRMGTFPDVWIPSAEVRDQRELIRLRLWLVRQRTRVKNRTQAILCNYGVLVQGVSNLFGMEGREAIEQGGVQLPDHTRQSVQQQLELLDTLNAHIDALEQCTEKTLGETTQTKLLQTAPGIGRILAPAILLHMGNVDRFATARHFSSYIGLVRGVESSGGHSWQGPKRQDANHYLKWAFTEAANCVVLNKKSLAASQVVQLYERVYGKTACYGKAVTAVARHLAEAVWHMLKKGEPCRAPNFRAVPSTPR